MAKDEIIAKLADADNLTKLINLCTVQGGNQKNIYCGTCNAVTTHISMTWSDFNKLAERNGFGPLGPLPSLIMDKNPGAKLMMGTPYLCKYCGIVRPEGGLLND